MDESKWRQMHWKNRLTNQVLSYILAKWTKTHTCSINTLFQKYFMDMRNIKNPTELLSQGICQLREFRWDIYLYFYNVMKILFDN